MIEDIPLVIFAGGKSSRMKQDKALLPFGGYPTLAQYQVERFKPLFRTIYLSSKTNKFDFECNLITDTNEVSSPLVGLCSIFESIKSKKVFILSVDAPFVTQKIIEKIITHHTSNTSVIAKSPSGVEPLCGLYSEAIVPIIYNQLRCNNHKLKDLITVAKSDICLFEEDAPFTNLNHPHEYQKALQIISTSHN